jgi:hypothetical protein
MAASNAVIGFDLQHALIKVLYASNMAKPSVETIPVSDEAAQAYDYVGMLESALSDYHKLPELQGAATTLLLPDNLVGIDYIGVPIMKKAKMAEALKTEFNGLYKNNEDLHWINYVIASGKRNAIYQVAMTDKPTLNALKTTLTNNKVPLKFISLQAAATMNAVYHLKQRVRRNSFIFVDIKEGVTNFIICGKEFLMGYYSLPFGYEILSREEVITESLLYEHDVAELAVINATELAKKKKLTVDVEEAEAIAEQLEEEAKSSEGEKQEGEEGEKKEEEQKPEENQEEGQEEEGDKQPKQEQDEYGYEADEIQQLAEKIKKVGKVYTKKVPKRLPMFMQRPIPETEEGFILENFRVFEKRILLTKRHCDYDQLMPKPEFIIINMPEEFEFVIDSLNQDEDNKVEFRFFNAQKDISPVILENLELYGGLFFTQFNRKLVL